MPNIPPSRTVSFTELKDFQQCRWMHWVKHTLGWRPKRMPKAPETGSAIHAGLAAFYKNQDPKAAIDAWALEQPAEAMEGSTEFEDLSIIIASAKIILDRFMTDPISSRYGTVLDAEQIPIIERRWYLPIPGYNKDVCLVGVWDALTIDKADGSLWLRENKTSEKSAPSPDLYLYSAQITIYQYAAHRLGYPVVGTSVLSLRTVAPKPPNLNKNGSMSRTKIISDWPTYLAALQSAGLDPTDYDDMRVHYEEMAPPLVSELPIYRGRDEIRKFMYGAVWPGIYDMLSPKRRIYRCPTFLCPRCSYREPCLMSIRGADIEEILVQQGFQKRRDENEESESEGGE